MPIIAKGPETYKPPKPERDDCRVTRELTAFTEE